MNPILHTIDKGGTEFGLSYYMSRILCPLRAKLDRDAKEARQVKRDDEEARGLVQIERPVLAYSQMLVGTIGHAYLEHWAKLALGETDPATIVEFDEIVDERARQKAQDAVSYYLKLWRLAPFGTVEAAEKDLYTDKHGPPLTGRLDQQLIVTAEDVHRLRTNPCWQVRGNVRALRPGRWILDFKFRSTDQASEEEKNLLSWQAVAYPDMAEEKIEGTLFVSIITTKNMQVKVTVVDGPTPEQVRALGDMIRYADSLPSYQAHPIDSACFSYFRTCDHMGRGCKARGVVAL